jgi:hypothetical protein
MTDETLSRWAKAGRSTDLSNVNLPIETEGHVERRLQSDARPGWRKSIQLTPVVAILAMLLVGVWIRTLDAPAIRSLAVVLSAILATAVLVIACTVAQRGLASSYTTVLGRLRVPGFVIATLMWLLVFSALINAFDVMVI